MIKEKQLLLNYFKEQISDMPSFVLANYGFMTASESVKLRKDLSELSEMEVVPKRIFSKAMVDMGIDFEYPLNGHVAVFFFKGEISLMVKVIEKYAKVKKTFEVLGSRVYGVVYGPEDTSAFGDLPTLDVARARLLSVMVGVQSRVVGVMSVSVSSLLYCLNARMVQQESSCQSS